MSLWVSGVMQFLPLFEKDMAIREYNLMDNATKGLKILNRNKKNDKRFNNRGYSLFFLKETRNSYFCVTPKNYRLMFVS